MSTPQGLESNHPILTHSTAARESTSEDAVPGHHDKKYHEQMSLIFRHGLGTPAATPNLAFSSAVPPSTHIGRDEAPPRYVEASNSHHEELRLGRASPVLPDIPPELASQQVTTMYAGTSEKPFHIHTNLLVQHSPVFATLTDPAQVRSHEMVYLQSGRGEATTILGPFFFADLDEFAFALFVRWIYGGALHGPKDFHSMTHYTCLYVLGQRFEIEELRNLVVDLIRTYYHREDMTAPPFRLDYIYKNTSGACLLREFLVATAALRALSLSDKFGGLSDSMKGVLSHEGDLAPDFANALVSLARQRSIDARLGDPCRWHEHKQTPKCPKWIGFEPFEDPSL